MVSGSVPHLVKLTRMSPLFCSLIINLPKTRSVVADTEHPDGDNKLVLLRVQHEGAPQRWNGCWLGLFRLSVMLIPRAKYFS